jgi:DinB superfamily
VRSRGVTDCAECGFVYEELEVDLVAGSLRSLSRRYADALDSVDVTAATQRPEPTTWSVLEYLCHVRDVLLVQRDRVVLTRVEDRPSVARMYREERVSLCNYRAHDVRQVLDQLRVAAELCATAFGAVTGNAWNRRLVYNWPNAEERDLAWLGRHTVHEAEHHLMDVCSVLSRVMHASPDEQL